MKLLRRPDLMAAAGEGMSSRLRRPLHNRHSGESRNPGDGGPAWIASIRVPYIALLGGLLKGLPAGERRIGPHLTFSAEVGVLEWILAPRNDDQEDYEQAGRTGSKLGAPLGAAPFDLRRIQVWRRRHIPLYPPGDPPHWRSRMGCHRLLHGASRARLRCSGSLGSSTASRAQGSTGSRPAP